MVWFQVDALPKKVLLVLVLRSPVQREDPQNGFKDQVSLG